MCGGATCLASTAERPPPTHTRACSNAKQQQQQTTTAINNNNNNNHSPTPSPPVVAHHMCAFRRRTDELADGGAASAQRLAVVPCRRIMSLLPRRGRVTQGAQRGGTQSPGEGALLLACLCALIRMGRRDQPSPTLSPRNILICTHVHSRTTRRRSGNATRDKPSAPIPNGRARRRPSRSQCATGQRRHRKGRQQCQCRQGTGRTQEGHDRAVKRKEPLRRRWRVPKRGAQMQPRQQTAPDRWCRRCVHE